MKGYVTPILNFVNLKAQDVVTASGGTEYGSAWNEEWNSPTIPQ